MDYTGLIGIRVKDESQRKKLLDKLRKKAAQSKRIYPTPSTNE